MPIQLTSKQLWSMSIIFLVSCGGEIELPEPALMIEEQIAVDIRDLFPAETCSGANKRLYKMQTIFEGEQEVAGSTYLRYRENHLVTVAADHLGVQQFRYDSVGRLTVILNGNQRDSIFYDAQGRMSNRQGYGKDDTPRLINTYYYDTLDQVIAISNEFEDMLLTWEDGNVVHEMVYFDDNLAYEQRYEYDDSPNFLKGNPIHIDWPMWYLSNNNILNTRTTSYGTQINVFCYDCEWSYEYDSEGYPIYRTNQYNSLTVLSFACD